MLILRVMAGGSLVLALLLVMGLEVALDRWLGLPGLALLVAFCGAIVLVARELHNLTRAKQLVTGPYALALWGVLGMVSFYLIEVMRWWPGSGLMLATLLGAVTAAAMWWHTRGRRTQGATAAGATALLAFVYMGMVPGFYLAIRCEFSVWAALSVIAVVKAGDIGAYFTGRRFGRHKLNTWLSPGKTWEGTAGGIAVAGAVAVACVAIGAAAGDRLGGGVDGGAGGLALSWPMAAAGGVVLGVVGQLGDLWASLIKRDAEQKDAGHGVPGFGGVLDVVDSAIPAAPVAYWLLVAAG